MTWVEVIEAHLRDEQIYLTASKEKREADEKEEILSECVLPVNSIESKTG